MVKSGKKAKKKTRKSRMRSKKEKKEGTGWEANATMLSMIQ
jgi:hypothetical protein